jgi:hypothetical protein
VVEKDSKLEERVTESGVKGTRSVKFLFQGRLVIAHIVVITYLIVITVL